MERIHVSVRSRPLSTEDARKSPWKISSDSIFMPNHPSFRFDRIFGEDCKTTEVYETRTKDIVAAAIRGFNGTVFAYGQTNSGKTHTMRGSQTEPGVIPLAVHDLFKTIYQDASRDFLLRMSYLEIYNEDIHDLLAPQHRKLQIHENLEKGIFVAGLREEIVSSPQQVLELMEFGQSHRHIGETNMNAHSSRSHTIFRMIIESSQKTQDEGACDAVRVSVLNLVDLAGSERASKTGAEGVRLKEGSHINKSLMTLGTVIKKLSEGVENRGGHVPYRDSKLTRILQPALGGNANTAIICNITLAPIHEEETKSTLQFASRALRVTNCAHVNEGKRRDTWGTSHLSRDSSTSEVQSHGLPRGSSLKSERSERETGTELLKNERLCSISEEDENSIDETLEDSALPDPCALVYVTRRKKPSSIRQKSPVVVESESDRIQREYEDFFLQYETERITKEIQIECLKAKFLGENDLSGEAACKHLYCRVVSNVHRDESSVHLRDPEDILLIKQLQEKISMLETEKSSSQKNLDELIRIDTVQCGGLQSQIEELSQEAQKHLTKLNDTESKLQNAMNDKTKLQEDFYNLKTRFATLEEELAAEREEKENAIWSWRRDTWGTGHLSQDSSTSEVQSHGLSRGSSLKSERGELETDTFLPFAELLKNERISEQDANSIDESLEDSALPDPCALVHMIRRKKPSSIREKSPVVVESESDKIQKEYEGESTKITFMDSFSFFKRERRQLWTLKEEEMLKLGVRTFVPKANKKIPWTQILEMGKTVFHHTRDPTNLKDKWKRMMSKASEITNSP